MNISTWLVVGLIAGWLESLALKGGCYGVIGDTIISIIGALIGGFLATNLFGDLNAINSINLLSILIALLGAFLTIGIMRAISPGVRV
jgi:uncharacterized membrane protein YeaQ/YmgE (transglycosylase-associated protein family)